MISVLISTYNKSKFLDITLAGYQNQSYKNFELVIIDDGSTDNTKEIVKKYEKVLNINYNYIEKNGISKARGKTLDNATGDYYIITDDDRIPCKDFVREHKLKLDSGEKCIYIGKECLVLSYFNSDIKFKFKDEFKLYNKFPELLSGEEKKLFSASDVIENFDDVLRDFYLSDYTESYLLNMVERYGENLNGFHLAWSRAYGGNMSFDKRKCSDKLVYDSNYRGYGIEDIDFSYQLYLQGFKFRFHSSAINYHQEHKRSRDENRQMFRNFEYFCNKYQNLDVKLMKMDWDGIVSLETANDFYGMLINHGDCLEDDITKLLLSDMT